MAKIPVRAVFGETYCHESESIEKVQKAFELFFPKKEIKITSKPGAFSTKIKILNANLEKRKARELVKKIFASLSKSDKNQISNQLELRLDKHGKLYLRFDKQLAYGKQKIALTEDEDAIQIVLSIEAFPAKYPNYVRAAKETLTL